MDGLIPGGGFKVGFYGMFLAYCYILAASRFYEKCSYMKKSTFWPKMLGELMAHCSWERI